MDLVAKVWAFLIIYSKAKIICRYKFPIPNNVSPYDNVSSMLLIVCLHHRSLSPTGPLPKRSEELSRGEGKRRSRRRRKGGEKG